CDSSGGPENHSARCHLLMGVPRGSVFADPRGSIARGEGLLGCFLHHVGAPVAGLTGTAGAAEDGAVILDAMSDHLAAAVCTGRRQGVNGTLEGVEDMLLTA